MAERSPWPRGDAVKSVGVGIVLTLITCGIYGLFWQYKQMQVLNAWLGRREYDFATWFVLSLVTCGIFAVYYEYRMARGINEIQHARGMYVQADLALLCVLLSIFGIGVASLAIQQHSINELYGEAADL